MDAPTLRDTLKPEIATALDAMLDAVHAWLRWQGDDGEHVTHILEPADTFMLDFRISDSPHAWCIDASDDTMHLFCMGDADKTDWWIPIEQVGYTPDRKRNAETTDNDSVG